MEDDEIAIYQAMTPSERLELSLELSEFFWQWLDVPDRETGDRKWAAWNREHDLSNAAILEALLKHRRDSDVEP